MMNDRNLKIVRERCEDNILKLRELNLNSKLESKHVKF